MNSIVARFGLGDPQWLDPATAVTIFLMWVGEQTGTLAEMHLNVAAAYESDVDYDLQRMNDLIEPLLIVCVGGMVLVLALGIYLPMWDFGS